jgi:AcrR family transcriptional regulator
MTAVMILPRKKQSVRELRKERTRAHLIEVAIKLFSRHGIDSTTVEQIASGAGVGKGTVYNYFAAKEDIIVAFMAELEMQARPAVKRFSESHAALEDILAGFSWHLLNAKRDYRTFLRAVLARMIGPDESFQPHVVEMQAAIDEILTALFSRLQARGKVRKSMAMEDLMMNFKTMHLGLTMLWALEGPPWRETRKVIKTQMGMFAKGVKP